MKKTCKPVPTPEAITQHVHQAEQAMRKKNLQEAHRQLSFALAIAICDRNDEATDLIQDGINKLREFIEKVKWSDAMDKHERPDGK